MMTVDGVPNVRVCTEPLREGVVVKGQNVVGSLDRDWMSITDKIGGPFTPPGFYYKTFIRPKRLWPLYEKFLRGAAGLGTVDPTGAPADRFDVEHRHVEVLVVGGGRAGLEAAIEAAQGGRHVALVDEGPEPGGSLLADADGDRRRARDSPSAPATRASRCCAPARAIGIYEGGLVPVDCGNLLVKRAGRPRGRGRGDHRAAARLPRQRPRRVMFPGAVGRLVNVWSLRPGERAVVLTVDDRGLSAAGDVARGGRRGRRR